MSLPDCEIYDLKCRSAAGEFNDPERGALLLLSKFVGQQVAIPKGPLTGHQATVTHIKNEMVKLRVEILGKDTYLRLPAAEVFKEIFDAC